MIVQQRLGIRATFAPVATRVSPLHTNTDAHYRQTYFKSYPHLMFTLIPWLNQEIPQQHVDDVYNMCTPTSRHAIMLLARLIGFGGRLASTDRLYDIVSHGVTPQMTRLILHTIAAHDLSDDDMLRWSERTRTCPKTSSFTTMTTFPATTTMASSMTFQPQPPMPTVIYLSRPTDLCSQRRKACATT